jgi:predicted enzyme related to lactoylglutathione lyase
MMAIARFQLVAIDCPDPRALAAFYSAITGWAETTPHEDYPDWVQLVADGAVTIAFQKVDGFRAPAWPGQEHPQQLHLDFTVPDLDAGESDVIAAGAVKHAVQPAPESFRVFLDPAGHPFCLVRDSYDS